MTDKQFEKILSKAMKDQSKILLKIIDEVESQKKSDKEKVAMCLGLVNSIIMSTIKYSLALVLDDCKYSYLNYLKNNIDKIKENIKQPTLN